MSKLLRSPFLAALLGGVVAAAVLLAFGAVGGTDTKTVVQQAPISGQPVGQKQSGLTARDIYKRDAPGVVSVRAQIVRQVTSPFDPFPQEQRGISSGSGFITDKSGYIITNAHVVDGASQVTVQFEGDKTRDAKIVGRDTSTDIALLKVDPSGLKLHPLALGDSKSVQVGDPTIAIGNPFGLDRTLTTGVVSALQRRIEAPNHFSIEDVIQTDAPINPGNSGGPLIDAAGRVIGINSQIETGGGGGGNVGIGFAVPINTVKKVMPDLRNNGSVERAFLGITGLTIDASLERLNLATKKGVLVQKVTAGSPAAKAGVKAGPAQAQLDGNQVNLGGDVIVKIDGKAVTTMDDIIGVVNSKKPGDQIELGIVRNGASKTLKVKLAKRPSEAPSK